MADYELYLCRDTGERIRALSEWKRLEYTLKVGAPGALALTLPKGVLDKQYVAVDRRIELWRRSPTGSLDLLGVFFIRRAVWEGDNNQTITLGGYDPLYLLSSRVVAAKSTSAEADKTDYADDMIKAYVSEAIAGDERGIHGLSVQADASAGYSLTRAASYDNLLTTCTAIAAASAAAGTRLRFGIAYQFDSSQRATFELQTRTPFWGDNRGQSSTRPLILSVERGTLAAPRLEVDWSNEATYVYAGGQGDGTARLVMEIYDTKRAAASVYDRREVFYDGRNYPSIAGLTAAGSQRLWNGRAVQKFSGQLVNRGGTEFQVDWGLGDCVIAEYCGQLFDVEILAISGVVAEGKETLTARLDYTSGDHAIT